MIGRHKFSSGVPDGTNSALILPSDWNQDILLGHVMTNRTGGVLTAGDVVAIDSANNDSVVLADTVGARRQYVVLVSAVPSSVAHTPGTTVADLATGIFLPMGAATVKVAGATTRGNYLRKSATAKALEDTSVAVGSAPPGDAIATALSSTGGAGTLAAVFRGLPISPGGNLKSVQSFTANDTWTRPAGIRRVIVMVVGAGGAGGGAAATGADQGANGGGGGGGGTATRLIDVTNIASATITVGAGGVGGTGAGPSGGNSSWADGTNTVTGNGGGGGNVSGARTGPAVVNGNGGGGASGGNIHNIAGGDGQHGLFFANGAEGFGGAGGDCVWFGRSEQGGFNNGAGLPGSNGAGGSGANNLASQSARNGGNGGAGIVLVLEYE